MRKGNNQGIDKVLKIKKFLKPASEQNNVILPESLVQK